VAGRLLPFRRSLRKVRANSPFPGEHTPTQFAQPRRGVAPIAQRFSAGNVPRNDRVPAGTTEAHAWLLPFAHHHPVYFPCSTIAQKERPTQRVEYNLTASSFEEFISFLFDKPVPPPKSKDHWYWNADVLFLPNTIAAYYVRLFTEPAFLLLQFDKGQLEQGFWAIQSYNLECSVARVIWDLTLPFSMRENCVRSMLHLFKRLFAIEPLDTSAYMWWDSLCYDWHCGNRSRNLGGEDKAMQDVMFQTLSQVLDLPSEHCQGAALHGLSHLHHPDTEELIAQFLKRNPKLEERKRSYALAASRFQVL
jgi:hypothetical protein